LERKIGTILDQELHHLEMLHPDCPIKMREMRSEECQQTNVMVFHLTFLLDDWDQHHDATTTPQVKGGYSQRPNEAMNKNSDHMHLETRRDQSGYFEQRENLPTETSQMDQQLWSLSSEVFVGELCSGVLI
jgi:hypothetical protein